MAIEAEAIPTRLPTAEACNYGGLCDRPIAWLRPWKCEDLEMKPFEAKPKFVGCNDCQPWIKNFFWCVPEEKKNGADD